MRKIDKDFNTPPSVLLKKGETVSKKGKVRREAVAQIKYATNNKSGSDYSSYKSPTVLKRLKEIYYNKCAYCESKVFKENIKLDGELGENKINSTIDHYRPKDALRGFDKDKHKGYYWLGNEWSNLLLCCSTCNIDHKKTQFPIENEVNRIYEDNPFSSGQFVRTSLLANSDFLMSEKALIIHPEIDNPHEHITFNSFGKIIEITEKGKKTIEVLNLSRFDDERNDSIRKIKEELIFVIRFFEEYVVPIEAFNKMLIKEFEKLYLSTQKEYEFSTWYQYIWNNFSDCILVHIDMGNPLRTTHIETIYEEFYQSKAITTLST